VRSDTKTASSGSFSAIHNELVISGADTGNGGNSTIFIGQVGWHDAAFYMYNHNEPADKRGKLTTDLVPSGKTDCHYHTCTGKSIRSSPQSSLLIVCRLTHGYVSCVITRNALRFGQQSPF
jgi:hypothetical protein